ncbi:zinc-binding alcohol dehydrogenase family protein [Coralloluteibacterium stylophorae]|uniref:Zinc-type alcohol dehydrogenase-like protein n=1 Tax=Coralloluteibacterium stylophorae TaxID=1776034 RepID=A0A8J8AX40_9GAMM|nr:zinc-binding alcohol dehydrogenase family protein [Coralloluteibacterium stylophorae]MBS7455850.1 zinc-binding alcohol dehydrogenase family protein [Coralloluteibacterium stylophorae]
MKAVGLTRYLPIDDPDALQDLSVPMPVPEPRDVLVRVEAVGVNPVDTKVRAPKDAPVQPSPRILGWDVAGVVEAVGAEVTMFRPGDEVYYAGDITRPGGNSRYAVADERIVALKPRTLDFAQAAALPLTALTAWESLFDRLQLDPEGGNAGQSLLIIGGGGGVGSLGIQFARRAGLTVITTASREETSAWVQELGADHVVDHRRPLRPQVEALGFAHVDWIADFANTDPYWDQMVDLVRPQGRIVTIVDNTGPLATAEAKAKSVTHAWEMMFTRARFRTPDMIEQHRILERVAAWIDDGSLRQTLKTRLGPIDAANLREAHRRLESGTAIGKIVVAGWKD